MANPANLEREYNNLESRISSLTSEIRSLESRQSSAETLALKKALGDQIASKKNDLSSARESARSKYAEWQAALKEQNK
jgi:predicted  nucleic acid-binding Zn-ribbon protein